MKPLLLAGLLAFSPLALHAAPALSDHPGALVILAGLEPVQAELGLSSGQVRRIDAIRASYRADAREIVASAADPSTSRKEAANALAKAGESANKSVLALLTQAQIQRLKQIELQKLEGTMLTSPAIQKSLGLSPSQQSRIAGIQDKQLRDADRITASFEDGRIDRQERIDQLRSLRLKASKSMLSVLTEAQRTQLEAMKGTPLAGL